MFITLGKTPKNNCQNRCIFGLFCGSLSCKDKELDMIKEIIEFIKEDPAEFFGSIAFLTVLFGGFYLAIHIGCPC